MGLALTGDDLQPWRRNSPPMCRLLSGWRHQLCFGRGERLEPFKLCGPAQLRCANSGPCSTGVWLLIKGPHGERPSTPWAYGRCRELRGDFYLERELDSKNAVRRACARVLAWSALAPGATIAAPAQRSAVRWWSRSRPACAKGLALLRQAMARWGWRMSGSGPILFACLRMPAAAEAGPGPAGGALQAEGFESWCCR